MTQEAQEQRNSRHAKLLETHLADVDRARARLMLEEGAQDVLATADQVWQAYSLYRLSIRRPGIGMTGPEIIDERRKLRESAERLVSLARAHLAALGRPR